MAMATTINATYYSVSWSARGDPNVGCLKPYCLSCRDSICGFALHRPLAQADNPLGDPGSCPGAVGLAEPNLGSQHRARVACRSSGGRIASNERAMQESQRPLVEG
jgi:hypothetical protein